MIQKIKSFLKSQSERIKEIDKRLASIERDSKNDLKNPKVNLGQLQAAFNSQKEHIDNLAEVEFQIFSQWGDDGIIQYLINKLDLPNKTFIEFGVENYTESNTRFLLINNNWSGYIIDGSKENIDYVKSDIVSWACELHAEASFITKENINDLLLKPGFKSEVGILSIDIDGNDYWVWKEINVINPVIVIVEYNSLFGKNTNWTVPYDPAFVRSSVHPSLLYYGASLKALCKLGEEKGYNFIGCNTKGNNAYFIRKDKSAPITTKTPENGYVVSKFREAIINGERITGEERIKVIEGLNVFDLDEKKLVSIKRESIKY